MCEQARRETQQWVMRRLLTADSIVEIGKKVGHELVTSHVEDINKFLSLRDWPLLVATQSH